jgi:hypothetical protein
MTHERAFHDVLGYEYSGEAARAQQIFQPIGAIDPLPLELFPEGGVQEIPPC